MSCFIVLSLVVAMVAVVLVVSERGVLVVGLLASHTDRGHQSVPARGGKPKSRGVVLSSILAGYRKLGPFLGLFSPADSGMDVGQERQIVRSTSELDVFLP